MANRRKALFALSAHRRFARGVLVGSLALLTCKTSLAAAPEQPFTIVVDQQSSYDSCKVIEMRVAEYILVERLKQTFHCESLPWIRAQLLVKSGERDAMVTIPTDERRGYAHISLRPVVSLNMRMFVANNSPHFAELIKAKSLDDLNAVTFIGQAGSGWAKKQIQSRKIAIEWASTIENVFRMLTSRRGDFTIQGDIYAIPILKALALEEQVTVTPAIFDRADYHFMISKRSPYRDLMRRFDVELNTMMADGSLKRITQQAMDAIRDETSTKQ